MLMQIFFNLEFLLDHLRVGGGRPDGYVKYAPFPVLDSPTACIQTAETAAQQKQ